jgi:hypothetical protein
MTPIRAVIISSILLIVSASTQSASSRVANNQHEQLPASPSNVSEKESAIQEFERTLHALNAAAESEWAEGSKIDRYTGNIEVKRRVVLQERQIHQLCDQVNAQAKELQSPKYQLSDIDMVRIERDMHAMHWMAIFFFVDIYKYKRPFVDENEYLGQEAITPLDQVDGFIQGKSKSLSGVDIEGGAALNLGGDD